ncbi:uncharacterized protein KIAA0825 homolog [Neoarius graeffei]|uniref:uncharacterized protein KIAA0825 homolog n=1 Tax=Neoarius graeffei TaxID=443677 RepID=UPI00298C1797|nr:uncharacterized protein KIAA0825 homolog [Neoarius graeffei]XP_060762923.1 uncharacterized protein KIAA0825 homolog [Neoarius graeffei]XP_060762924.1 uncharacterized protein KIAA0825 homolog [Neoarius graeffei]XP_060762925.1 uncharacterized protein KIAA0825 homolog [Neoarius graeffei]XP_060762926.1 uncharacterized protein KIAA0825 homolog [Neoarius graeffei]
MERQGDSPHDHAFVALPLPSMLSGSGEADLQVLIRETEEKLKLNACSIEQNLCELQTKIGEALAGEKVPSPTECLKWFHQSNMSSLKPVSTDHQELLDFLKALQHLLKTEEAYTEAVLQLLLNISSQCGVAFPTSDSLSEQSQTFMAPFCSVHDNIALEVQETWDDVRLLLRHHLLDKLSMDGSGVPEKAVVLVHQLCFLYTETEVLEKYQALRSKTVLGLLRNKQTCCPDGGSGFQRLAVGFQAVCPPFCAMLCEDIHVLNGIVEPHCILSFVNQTYLWTLVQELDLLMEVVLKDNSAQGEKGMRSSSKKAAVAPQDTPQTSRNFSLTSEQLRGLVQLATTLLQLERQVEDLATELGFLNCAGESSGVKGNLKKVRDDVEMSALDGKVTSDLLLHSTEVVCLEFEWRAAFQVLAPQMVHGVKMFLEDVCSKSLHQEERTHSSTSSLIPRGCVSLRQEAELSPERDMPKTIAKFCADVMEELDALLTLAVVCKEDALLPVCSCYIEVCGQVTSALLTRLEERAREVPHASPLKNLPTILASSTYIHHRLVYYESQLGDTNRMPLTLLPVQRSQEVTEAVHEHLTSYCVHVCATSILQDAESHYWADDNSFYEGERCSFSIQMWHYFLSALRSDLWSTVSPLLAKQTLAQVLAQTLELLLQRYSRAQPSYKRHPQIRLDITAILLCVEQLIWSVCHSVEELVGPELPSETSRTWVSIIHSLCNQLLNVLIILTAPLTELYRTFQNGFSEESSTTPADGHTKHAPFWLNIFNPTLFPLDQPRGGSESESSTLCLLNIVISGPGFSPALLLQAILHHDCLLLRLLISHSCLCLDSKVEVSPEAQEAAAAEFVEAIFALLSSLNNVPRALALVLEGYLDRRHLWDHFCSLADPVKGEPVLFKCVRDVICKPISTLLRHLVSMMQVCEACPSSLLRQNLPESVQAKIPKEWNYTPQEAKTKDSNKTISLTIQVLSFIFTHLPSCVASIPMPVRFLFHTAEKQQCQSSRQLRPTGLLIRVLLGFLCQSLENGETLELVSTEPLERGVKERLALLSECLQVSLGLEKGKPKPSVHKILQGLEGKRPKWSSMQLQKAHKLCSESMFEHVESGLVQDRGGPSEPAEQKMCAVLLALCQGAGGIQNLKQIHHTIQLNEGLLRSKLASAKDSTSSPEGPPSVLFSSAANALNSPPHFNPLFHFDHVGHAKFDQAAMSKREWDWAQVLSAYQSLSQVTFTDLLANRWEMQDGALLEDEEKTLVDHFKKAYLNKALEPCSEISE